MSVENNSNQVTLVTIDQIDSLEKLARWLSHDGLNYDRLCSYESWPNVVYPLEQYEKQRLWGLPVSKTYKKTVLDLVRDTLHLAREKPREFVENPQNRREISIVKEFFRELERWYFNHYFEVRELLGIQIIRNLINIQN